MDRSLAAIFAADVVGYSRLMRADEEGTLKRLKALLVKPGGTCNEPLDGCLGEARRAPS